MGRPIFAGDFRGLPPTNAFIRGDREDPVPAASQVVGAQTASLRDFRTVGANGKLGTLLTSGDVRVWALGARLIQVDGKLDWRMDIRLGPHASAANPPRSYRPQPVDPFVCTFVHEYRCPDRFPANGVPEF